MINVVSHPWILAVSEQTGKPSLRGQLATMRRRSLSASWQAERSCCFRHDPQLGIFAHNADYCWAAAMAK